MTAFVTLAGVYNTPVFGVERSRDQDLMTTSRALDQFLSSVEKRASVAATDRLIGTWADRGMRFVTIPEMVEAAGAGGGSV